MSRSSAPETTRFMCAIWQTATGEKEVFLSRKQSLKAAQEMLRHYWKLPDTAVILFELERSRSDGTTRRGGIPPEIWAEVLDSPVENIFVNVVNEKQEPSQSHTYHARQKQAQFTTQTPTPIPTFSAGSSSSHRAVTSSGDEYRGGAFRPSRKKHRSSTSLSHGRNGWRKAGRRAHGNTPCRQCLKFGIPCVLQTPTALLCMNCKTNGLSCSNKPRDIGKIEYALRTRQLSPDRRSSVSTAFDSEPAGSLIQDGSAEHVIGVDDSCSVISDSEEYDELQE